MTEAWHGTVGGYTSHGCRCDECRAAWSAYHRAYYEANREQVAARQRAYYEANREQVAARQRAYYRQRVEAAGFEYRPRVAP